MKLSANHTLEQILEYAEIATAAASVREAFDHISSALAEPVLA